MRGKAVLAVGDTDITRITPAYAGKRYPVLNGSEVERDHPRLCGEKLLAFWGFFRRKGSPPPMRGKAAVPDDEKQDHKDHPRLCGEKVNRTRCFLSLPGITPAYAGKR